MTIARLLPLPIHGAMEVALALVIMAAPFVLGLGPAAMIASLLLGALVLGVALATHAGDEDALPVSTHAAFDYGFAVAMGITAVVFAFTGELGAAGLLAAGGVGMTLISAFTRYSPSHR